ncbi:hypothetical protein Fokcrypt_00002 [Candidatus Fokinia cryptica]|uniref:Uncharacterized protein n=1 Tax=Candidatus Fokinia crypta TaxID=1920990 RepID=A0ABZ0UR70_9RICK|nr:hypothetical protein Fokcrypt_00002 [Candidatus Fokinia cryptica]
MLSSLFWYLEVEEKLFRRKVFSIGFDVLAISLWYESGLRSDFRKNPESPKKKSRNYLSKKS